MTVFIDAIQRVKPVMLGGVKKLACGCILFDAAALFVGSRPLVAAGQDFTGHWESTSPLKVGALGLSVDLAKGATGEWVGSLSDPVRKVVGIRVVAIAIKGDRLQFMSPDLPGTPSYNLTLRKNSLVGTVSVQGNALPLTMKRTGNTDVKITPPSPAVSSSLRKNAENRQKHVTEKMV